MSGVRGPLISDKGDKEALGPNSREFASRFPVFPFFLLEIRNFPDLPPSIHTLPCLSLDNKVICGFFSENRETSHKKHHSKKERNEEEFVRCLDFANHHPKEPFT